MAPESNRPTVRLSNSFKIIAKVFFGIVGFRMLTGPESLSGSVAFHQGELLGRVIGAAILFLVVFPFGRPRKLEQQSPDEL